MSDPIGDLIVTKPEVLSTLAAAVRVNLGTDRHLLAARRMRSLNVTVRYLIVVASSGTVAPLGGPEFSAHIVEWVGVKDGYKFTDSEFGLTFDRANYSFTEGLK